GRLRVQHCANEPRFHRFDGPRRGRVSAVSAAAQAPAILVVDDDAFVLITLKRVTRDVPARMVFASNLKEAWAAVNAELPELVIADYRLPDGDGLGFIEKLQARHPGLKCVLHTGEAVSRTAVGLDIPVDRKS